MHVSSGSRSILLPHIMTLVPSLLLLCSPKQRKLSQADISFCIRSPCSLTQIHLASHSSFRTPSKTEHYRLPLLFSHRKLSGLFSFQHQVDSFWVPFHCITFVHFSGAFILLWNQSVYLSLSRSTNFQTRGQHVSGSLINVWRVYKMSLGSAVFTFKHIRFSKQVLIFHVIFICTVATLFN